MPCTGNIGHTPSPGLSSDEVRDIVRSEMRRGSTREADIDICTRYLCGFLTALKRQGKDAAFINMVEKTTDGVEIGEIAAWWARHQELDSA